MEKLTINDVDKVDLEALERALDLTLAEKDQGRVEQVRAMLAEDGWHEAATFATFHRQTEHLQLAPWEEAPCHIDPDHIDAIISRGPDNNNAFGAAKLLKRMLAHSISQYDPSPIDALAAAKRRLK
jgi:hypothetical protein